MIGNKKELAQNLEGVKESRKETIINLLEKYLGDFYFIETFGKNFQVDESGKGWSFNNTNVFRALNKTSIFASKIIEDKKMLEKFFNFLQLQKDLNDDISFNAEGIIPIVVEKILENRKMLEGKMIAYRGVGLEESQKEQTLRIFADIKKHTEMEYLAKINKINSITHPIEFKERYTEAFKAFLEDNALTEKHEFNGYEFDGIKEKFIVSFSNKINNERIKVELSPEDIALRLDEESGEDSFAFVKESKVFEKILIALSDEYKLNTGNETFISLSAGEKYENICAITDTSSFLDLNKAIFHFKGHPHYSKQKLQGYDFYKDFLQKCNIDEKYFFEMQGKALDAVSYDNLQEDIYQKVNEKFDFSETFSLVQNGKTDIYVMPKVEGVDNIVLPNGSLYEDRNLIKVFDTPQNSLKDVVNILKEAREECVYSYNYVLAKNLVEKLGLEMDVEDFIASVEKQDYNFMANVSLKEESKQTQTHKRL